MSGKPKPAVLKLIGGTDRKDRRNDLEPEPALLQDLTPPEGLTPDSAEVWTQLAPVLRRMQVLTEADVTQFELLCDTLADYRAVRAIRGDQFVIPGSKGGQMLSQYLVAQQMLSKRAQALMSSFGLDPVSRSRIMVNPQGDLFDKPAGAARFFK